MKKMLIHGLMAVSLANAQTPQQLSLEEAIQIGKQNSNMLHIAGLKLDAAVARSSEAHAALLPSLKFDGSYKRVSDIEPFVLQFPPLITTPIEIMPNIPNTYSLHLGVQQPLFTGFRLSSNARAAERLAEASQADREGSESDLVFNVINAYWMLYQANETKRYVAENVDRLASYEADTKNLMNAGLATRNDLLRIQVQYASARLSQIDAANDVDVASMNLNNAIGQPVETQVQLTSLPAGTAHDSAHAPPDSLVAVAIEMRPDLAAMRSRVEAARANVTATEGGWWPQISLIADYLYARPNPRYLPAKDEFKGTWDAGIVMQFDIWNWGTTLSQSEQAKAQLQQNEYTYAQMKDNASLDVRRSLLGVVRAAQRIGVAHDAVEQADENSRTTNEKYKNGLATSTELLDASVAVLQARTNYSGALVEYEIARARLDKALGK
jgi:outer membrane protein TolC